MSFTLEVSKSRPRRTVLVDDLGGGADSGAAQLAIKTVESNAARDLMRSDRIVSLISFNRKIVRNNASRIVCRPGVVNFRRATVRGQVATLPVADSYNSSL